MPRLFSLSSVAGCEVNLCRAVQHPPAHLLMARVDGIAAQVAEVLYAGHVDIACGHPYAVLVVEQQRVVVSPCRVIGDYRGPLVCDVGRGHGPDFRDVLGVGGGKHLHVAFQGRLGLPLHNAVAHAVLLAHHGDMGCRPAAGGEQHRQGKSV